MVDNTLSNTKCKNKNNTELIYNLKILIEMNQVTFEYIFLVIY